MEGVLLRIAFNSKQHEIQLIVDEANRGLFSHDKLFKGR